MLYILKALLPLFVLYFVFLIVLCLSGYFIDQSLIERTWLDYSMLFFMSSVFSLCVIYAADTRRYTHWYIISGAVVPFVISLIMNVVSWFLNNEVLPTDLINNFVYCSYAMLISIPATVCLCFSIFND